MTFIRVDAHDDFLGGRTDLPTSRLRAWQASLTSEGSGSFSIPNDADDLAFVNAGRFATFKIDDTDAFTILVEKPVATIKTKNEAVDQATAWSGPGHLAVLEWALVRPARGLTAQPVTDDRGYNWTSNFFDDSAFVPVTVYGTIADARAVEAAQRGFPPEISIPDFPDPFAGWVWAAGQTTSMAAEGACYYRQEVGSDDKLYTFVFAWDDYGEAYLDGQLVASATGRGFFQTQKVTLQLSAGTHIIAMRGVNGPDLEGWNPAGVAWTMFEALDDNTYGVGPVAHSDATGIIVEYATDPPGWTLGAVLLRALAEATDLATWDDLGGITPMFDAGVDSDGTSWPVVADISTRVGTDYLTFFQELAATYCDLWMEPGTLNLHAWVKDGRGGSLGFVLYTVPAPGAGFPDGNIIEFTTTGDALLATVLVVRWAGGYFELEDTDAVAAHGRREGFLSIGAISSQSEAERVAQQQLDENARIREAVELQVQPGLLGPADIPAVDVNPGDTVALLRVDDIDAVEFPRVQGYSVSEDVDTGRILYGLTLQDVVLSPAEVGAATRRKLTPGSLHGSPVAQPFSAGAGVLVGGGGGGSTGPRFAWVDYTPSWTVGFPSLDGTGVGDPVPLGTQPDIGDGTLIARYRRWNIPDDQPGAIDIIWIRLVIGSTTVLGDPGPWRFSLPRDIPGAAHDDPSAAWNGTASARITGDDHIPTAFGTDDIFNTVPRYLGQCIPLESGGTLLSTDPDFVANNPLYGSLIAVGEIDDVLDGPRPWGAEYPENDGSPWPEGSMLELVWTGQINAIAAG